MTAHGDLPCFRADLIHRSCNPPQRSSTCSLTSAEEVCSNTLKSFSVPPSRMSDLEASLRRSASSAWQLEVRISYRSLLRAACAMTRLPPSPGQRSHKHSSASCLLVRFDPRFFFSFSPRSDTTSGSISRRQQHLMSCSSLFMEG